MKFGNSKQKQSTVNQTYPTGLRKDSLHSVKNPSTNVSKYKGRKNVRQKSTQVDNAIQESNPRKTVAISSSRSCSRLVTHQQHILQTLDDIPEEPCKPFSPALSGLKNGLDNNIEACSTPKDTHTQSLDLSENQEIQSLELESSDQAKAVSFSGHSLHKETKLPIVTTDQQPHTHQEQQYISPYKSHENSNLDANKEILNKWKKCNNDIHGDCCTSEKTVPSKKVICSTGCRNHHNYKEDITNREGMNVQQFLPSEDHFSQENKLKVGGLSILAHQEAVNFSNSNNIAVSEPHVANYECCVCGTSFDHSHGNPEHTSLVCTRTLSTHEVSKLTSHVEDCCSPRVPTPLMNQTDTHIVERVNKKEDAKRNYTDKGQKTNSSNESLSTVVHHQVIETTKVENRKQDLPESEIIHNIDFHSTENMNKELANISQVRQREEKEISPKTGISIARFVHIS